MPTQLRSHESEPVHSLQDYVAMFHRRRTLIVLAGGVSGFPVHRLRDYH